jgi:hypothetical protein
MIREMTIAEGSHMQREAGSRRAPRKIPARSKDCVKTEKWLAGFAQIIQAISLLHETHSILRVAVTIGPSATNPKEIYILHFGPSFQTMELDAFEADAMDRVEASQNVRIRQTEALKRKMIRQLIVDGALSGAPGKPPPSRVFLAIEAVDRADVSPHHAFVSLFVPKPFSVEPKRKLRSPVVSVHMKDASDMQDALEESDSGHVAGALSSGAPTLGTSCGEASRVSRVVSLTNYCTPQYFPMHILIAKRPEPSIGLSECHTFVASAFSTCVPHLDPVRDLARSSKLPDSRLTR